MFLCLGLVIGNKLIRVRLATLDHSKEPESQTVAPLCTACVGEGPGVCTGQHLGAHAKVCSVTLHTHFGFQHDLKSHITLASFGLVRTSKRANGGVASV